MLGHSVAEGKLVKNPIHCRLIYLYIIYIYILIYRLIYFSLTDFDGPKERPMVLFVCFYFPQI